MPVFIFHINNGKEITYLILYKEMKNMNGNNPAGAQAESRLRLLLTYKGSAYAGENIRDDYIFLSLVHDGSPDPLASAVINFPVIDGKRVLFIHDIQPHGEKESLIESIESIARKRGYDTIYINTSRQEKNFLKNQGFIKLPGRMMAKKVLSNES